MKKVYVDGARKRPVITEQPSQRITKNDNNLRKGKHIFNRIAEIVVDDVKGLLGIDQKSRENKMRYDAFMDMCRREH